MTDCMDMLLLFINNMQQEEKTDLYKIDLKKYFCKLKSERRMKVAFALFLPGTLGQRITNLMFMKFQINSELCYFHNGLLFYNSLHVLMLFLCALYRFEPSIDNIKMQDCQVYGLNKRAQDNSTKDDL